MAGATDCSSLRCLPGFGNSLKRTRFGNNTCSFIATLFWLQDPRISQTRPSEQFPPLPAGEGRLLNSNRKLGSKSAHVHCPPSSSSSLWQALGKFTAGVQGVVEGLSKADLPSFSGGDVANSCYSPHHTHTRNLSFCIFKKFSRTKTTLKAQTYSPGPFPWFYLPPQLFPPRLGCSPKNKTKKKQTFKKNPMWVSLTLARSYIFCSLMGIVTKKTDVYYIFLGCFFHMFIRTLNSWLLCML